MKMRMLLCGLLLLSGLSGVASAGTDAAALMERLKNYHYGGDRSVLDAVTQWVSEARSDAVGRHDAARDLTAVLTSDAAFDAKEFACRQLVLVASDEQIPVLTSALRDDALAHYALMVLARIPGPAVNDALRRELQRHLDVARVELHDATSMEIIDMLGERQDRSAIDLIGSALDTPDRFAAASFALAKMGDPRAARFLRGERLSAGADARERSAVAAEALLLYADRARTGGDTPSAVEIYTLLGGDENPVVNAAALRGLIEARGETALPLVIRALAEDGSRRQSVALGVLRDLPGKQVTLRLAEALPKLTPHGQTLLLAALSDRSDSAAAPAVMALCGSVDPGVSAAALTTLGALGDAASVSVLLEIASAGQPARRAAAHAGLVALRGRAVDARLTRALAGGRTPLVIEAISVLSERGTATRAILLPVARSPRHEESVAALRALRDVGQPEDLPQLVALALDTPAGKRDDALETIAAVARRGTGERQQTGAILAALNARAAPADRADLLTVLARIGGPAALDRLRHAVTDPAPDVQTTSLRLLAEWETDEPLADLLRACRTTRNPATRAVALRGYLRMISLNEERSPDQALKLYRATVEIIHTDEEKRLLLAGVQRLTSLAALEFASGYLSDPTVRPEAEAAVVHIGGGTRGAWPDETRKALTPLAQNAANESVRAGARETLARIANFGDFVMAWELSPSYQQEGADYTKLFDISFPPEEVAQAEKVPWRLLPVGANPDQPWLLDIFAVWGGEQRVAYLRTAIYSETGRELALELGSDDGIKAWWNGGIVLDHNTARAVAPAQEKVTVHVKPGWNQLLLKITQNNQGWAACARFTNLDGSPATGLLRYRVPSAL